MRRFVFALVSGSMGAMVGLLAAFLLGRTFVIIPCAIVGAALSLVVRR